MSHSVRARSPSSLPPLPLPPTGRASADRTGRGSAPRRACRSPGARPTTVAWKTDLPGAGASSPVFIGDRIFLTAWTGFAVPGQPGGREEDLKRHLICLDRKTGKQIWDKEIAAKLAREAIDARRRGLRFLTPVVDAERVYCFFGKSGVFAFDHAGKELWRADVGDGLEGWASSSSPILVGDLVIVNASIESESVVALDKSTGKEKWRATGIREAYNTPLVVKNKEGKDELVVAAARKIFAFDPATGAALWNCNTDIGWYMVPSVVAHDGVVYCIGGRSGVIGLAVRTGGKGDVTRTHRLWTSKKGGNVSSPVFHDGHVYWMNDASGTAYCAKAETGEVVYEERIPRAGRCLRLVAARRWPHLLRRPRGPHVRRRRQAAVRTARHQRPLRPQQLRRDSRRRRRPALHPLKQGAVLLGEE